MRAGMLAVAEDMSTREDRRALRRVGSKSPMEKEWDAFLQEEQRRRYAAKKDYVVGRCGLSPPESLRETKIEQPPQRADSRGYRAEFLQRGRALSDEHAADSPVRACPLNLSPRYASRRLLTLILRGRSSVPPPTSRLSSCQASIWRSVMHRPTCASLSTQD